MEKPKKTLLEASLKNISMQKFLYFYWRKLYKTQWNIEKKHDQVFGTLYWPELVLGLSIFASQGVIGTLSTYILILRKKFFPGVPL